MSDQVFAYAVVGVAIEKPAALELGSFEPGIEVGDIVTFESSRGPEFVDRQADGPIVKVITGAKIGAVALDADGGVVPTLPQQRLMALIQIGAGQEKVLRETLHMAFDDVRDQVVDEPNASLRAFRTKEIEKKYTK